MKNAIYKTGIKTGIHRIGEGTEKKIRIRDIRSPQAFVSDVKVKKMLMQDTSDPVPRADLRIQKRKPIRPRSPIRQLSAQLDRAIQFALPRDENGKLIHKPGISRDVLHGTPFTSDETGRELYKAAVSRGTPTDASGESRIVTQPGGRKLIRSTIATPGRPAGSNATNSVLSPNIKASDLRNEPKFRGAVKRAIESEHALKLAEAASKQTTQAGKDRIYKEAKAAVGEELKPQNIGRKLRDTRDAIAQTTRVRHEIGSAVSKKIPGLNRTEYQGVVESAHENLKGHLGQALESRKAKGGALHADILKRTHEALVKSDKRYSPTMHKRDLEKLRIAHESNAHELMKATFGGGIENPNIDINTHSRKIGVNLHPIRRQYQDLIKTPYGNARTATATAGKMHLRGSSFKHLQRQIIKSGKIFEGVPEAAVKIPEVNSGLKKFPLLKGVGIAAGLAGAGLLARKLIKKKEEPQKQLMSSRSPLIQFGKVKGSRTLRKILDLRAGRNYDKTMSRLEHEASGGSAWTAPEHRGGVQSVDYAKHAIGNEDEIRKAANLKKRKELPPDAPNSLHPNAKTHQQEAEHYKQQSEFHHAKVKALEGRIAESQDPLLRRAGEDPYIKAGTAAAEKIGRYKQAMKRVAGASDARVRKATDRVMGARRSALGRQAESHAGEMQGARTQMIRNTAIGTGAGFVAGAALTGNESHQPKRKQLQFSARRPSVIRKIVAGAGSGYWEGAKKLPVVPYAGTAGALLGVRDALKPAPRKTLGEVLGRNIQTPARPGQVDGYFQGQRADEQMRRIEARKRGLNFSAKTPLIRFDLKGNLKKAGIATVATAGGGLVGATYGTFGGALSGHRELKNLQDRLANEKGVDSRAYVAQHGGGAQFIGSPKDVKRKDYGWWERRQVSGMASQAAKGKNAFAGVTNKGKEIVVAGKNAPEDVLAHEIGHLKDMRKNGKIRGWEYSPIGSVTGHQMKREEAAWKESGHPTDENAIATYRKIRTGSRIGAAIGAAGGLGASLYAMKHLRKLTAKADILRFDVSPLQNLRNKIRPEEKPTTAHDIAVGGIEGGAGVLATDHLISKFAPKGSPLWRKLAIGTGVGAVATGLIGAGVSAASKAKKDRESVFASKRKLIMLSKPVRKDHSVTATGAIVGAAGGTAAGLASSAQDLFALGKNREVGRALGKSMGPISEEAAKAAMKRINAPARSIAKRTAKAALIGTAIGTAVGLAGATHGGNIRQARADKRAREKVQRMSSRSPSIHFSMIAPGTRTAVTKDRYVKQIHERDMDRTESGYLRTGAGGAAIGALTAKRFKVSKSKAALIGGLTGLGTQAIARQSTKSTRDQFGDRSFNGKRADRLPSQIAGIAALGLAGKAAHDKLAAAKIAASGMARKAKLAGLAGLGLWGASKLFSAGRSNDLIRFDDKKEDHKRTLKAGAKGAIFGAIPGAIIANNMVNEAHDRMGHKRDRGGLGNNAWMYDSNDDPVHRGGEVWKNAANEAPTEPFQTGPITPDEKLARKTKMVNEQRAKKMRVTGRKIIGAGAATGALLIGTLAMKVSSANQIGEQKRKAAREAKQAKMKMSAREELNAIIQFAREPESPEHLAWKRGVDASRAESSDWRKSKTLVNKTTQGVKRGHRLLKDVVSAAKGQKNLDSRGRERKREWDKPWVRNAVTGGIGITTAAVFHKAMRGSGPGSGLRNVKEVFDNGQLGEAIGRKVPGFNAVRSAFKKVRGQAGDEAASASEGIGHKVANWARKNSTPAPVSTADISGAEKRAKEAASKRLKGILKSDPKSILDYSSRSPVIKLAAEDWETRREGDLFQVAKIRRRDRRAKKLLEEKKWQDSAVTPAKMGASFLAGGLAAQLYNRQTSAAVPKTSPTPGGGTPIPFRGGQSSSHLDALTKGIASKAKKAATHLSAADPIIELNAILDRALGLN